MGSRREARAIYTCGDVEVDCEARLVRVAGRRQILTYGEFEVLLRLVRNRGRVLTREDLTLHLRGAGSASPRSVDTCVTRLRCKLRDARMFSIETVQRVGYRCDGRSNADLMLGFPEQYVGEGPDRGPEPALIAGEQSRGGGKPHG